MMKLLKDRIRVKEKDEKYCDIDCPFKFEKDKNSIELFRDECILFNKEIKYKKVKIYKWFTRNVWYPSRCPDCIKLLIQI